MKKHSRVATFGRVALAFALGASLMGWSIAPALAEGTPTDTSTATLSENVDQGSSMTPQAMTTTSIMTTTASPDPTVSYNAHVQEKGWSQGFVNNGATAGTTGQNLRVEAFKVKVSGVSGLSVQYRAHVQNEGWLSWVSNGAIGGTTGKNQRLEAFQVKLAGSKAGDYDIYYRAHVQGFGWLGWAKNSASVGSSGVNRRVEAMQIKIVKKGAAAPGSTANPYIARPSVRYRAHVSNEGWKSWVAPSTTAGTTGKNRGIEAIQGKVTTPISGDLRYKVRIQGSGWTDSWVTAGATSGTTGQNKKTEAFAFKLTGDLSKFFDVYYRAYVQEYGWLGWAKNGDPAGTLNIKYRLEGIQVKLVAKGSAAPGSTKNSYTSKKKETRTPVCIRMDTKAASEHSATNWLIMIDYEACRLGVYHWTNGKWERKYYWMCSPGQYSTPTVHGRFSVGEKGYAFSVDRNTCYYYTQFYGNYLIHSTLYHEGTWKVKNATLGKHLSHGCVRLLTSNAYWVYSNIPRGTRVYVY